MINEYQAIRKQPYGFYERQCSNRINRKCIDGRITGCGSCVAYCAYEGHPGFLTERHLRNHHCIEKGCNYYVKRPRHEKTAHTSGINKASLLKTIQKRLSDFEGIRVLDICISDDNVWHLKYVTISNAYKLHALAFELSTEFGYEVRFERLNYTFDRCVQLILS